MLVSEHFASDTHTTCGAQSGGRVCFCISCCICTFVCGSTRMAGFLHCLVLGNPSFPPFISTQGRAHTVLCLTPSLCSPLLAFMLSDWRHAVLLPQSGPGVTPLCLLSPHMHVLACPLCAHGFCRLDRTCTTPHRFWRHVVEQPWGFQPRPHSFCWRQFCLKHRTWVKRYECHTRGHFAGCWS